MLSRFRTGWRRDVLTGLLASIFTGVVLVPVGWAALQQQRERADDAQRQALEAVRLAKQEVAQTRDQAQRALVDQAADVLRNFGGPEKSEAESMQVTTSAVAPEIPEGAYVLIDKKTTSYATGDIVVFRVGEKNFLGRVVSVEKAAGRMTVGRNNEADRQIAIKDVLGRGVLNTR